eukprot:CAMPEP_0202407386 /NCGR_PEP_ID=MMETSP1128-20130828/11989_1 /ASSEMBLY_ACC=CAM_ASM_000463 /TAXON_ID=3047 /ORGANISM="Dunaliella tertiolecta, Strain CCMP1320" /LENGTH=81 /DNA_ID=CAMNT_0049012367 /DNA_START=874 /DNA_END=1119 /DNA_ORIENTATION=+
MAMLAERVHAWMLLVASMVVARTHRVACAIAQSNGCCPQAGGPLLGHAGMVHMVQLVPRAACDGSDRVGMEWGARGWCIKK